MSTLRCERQSGQHASSRRRTASRFLQFGGQKLTHRYTARGDVAGGETVDVKRKQSL
jgi:hypothetical protein